MEITDPILFEVLAAPTAKTSRFHGGPLDTGSNRRPFPRLGSRGPIARPLHGSGRPLGAGAGGLVMPARTREVLGASLTILAITAALLV